jgi:tetratricopeptide (TPR) repeat protein
MAAGLPALGALLKKATIEDHEEIIKACNATLKQSKGNLEAQQTKVVALLKLDRYDDALHVFEESGEELKSKARLEHAYTLYKVGDLEQALSEARQIQDSRAARHLEAQTVCTFALVPNIHKSESQYSLTAPRTLPTQPVFIRSCQRIFRRLFKERKMIYESMVGLQMRSWSGNGGDIWHTGGRWTELILRHSRPLITEHAVA